MILYIQTAFLGDLLLSVPTLKRLRHLYPDQEIHLLCRKGLGDFFVREALVDRVMDDFKGPKPTLKEAKKMFADKSYHLLFCPHESVRSTMIARQVQAQKKIGYDSFINRFVFDSLFKRPMKWPEAVRQMSLLRDLDPELSQWLVSIAYKKSPFAEIPEWSSMTLPHFLQRFSYRETFIKRFQLDENKKINLLAPGSVWATKRWGASRFIELAQEMVNQGEAVVLIGSRDEKDLADHIQSQVSGAINIAGLTKIPEMIDLIAGADLLVANDSGAMHMASITGTPCVAVFGPTVQSFGYQPWNNKARVVENIQLKCRPCSSHGGKKCPLGTHECMTSISSSQVAEVIKEFSSL